MALYATTIILNVLLIIYAILNLLFAGTLFYFVRKIGKYEREKMLPMSILNLHAREFTEDYNKKLKEIIGDNERNFNNNNENNLYNEQAQD